MTKNTSLLMLTGLVLWGLALSATLSYSHHLHNTYGFLSKIWPLPYKATTEYDSLILDFAPRERGLGIVELDIARQNRQKSGAVRATLAYEHGQNLISSETYTTTHIDSSKPLLISFDRYTDLNTNDYRLTLQADPISLLPDYLVQSGLQARGVYFMTHDYLKQNPLEIIRLVGWKIADLDDTFTVGQLIFLLIVPLLSPFIVYLLWYQYKKKLLRKLVMEYIVHYSLKPLTWSRQFNHHMLLSARHNKTLFYSLYKKLFIAFVIWTYVTLTRWYVQNQKMIWDAVFVIVWSLTNLVYAVTKIEITDPWYIGFAVAYLAFAALRRVDSRLHYIGALFTLGFCPYYLSLGLEKTAEKTAIFVYGFMVAGAFFDAISLYRDKSRR